MNLIKLFISSIVLLAIVGCASPASGPAYSKLTSTSPNNGIVYMYRQSRFFQGGTYPNVVIDGIEKFPLRNGGYNFVELSPGEHTIGTWLLQDYFRLCAVCGRAEDQPATPVGRYISRMTLSVGRTPVECAPMGLLRGIDGGQHGLRLPGRRIAG